MREYYRLVDIVADFDQRLLTVKSWGVTFALATLGLGFQQDHYGLFLVAAAGALGFWLIEASTKSHQMRYYPRMGDIEVLAHELYGESTERGIASSPMIDWGWRTAAPRIWGERPKRRQWFARFAWGEQSEQGSHVGQESAPRDPHVPQRWAAVNTQPGTARWLLLWPHVALPHAIAVVLGVVLFVLGAAGQLGPI
jgi:hypothetical protein